MPASQPDTLRVVHRAVLRRGVQATAPAVSSSSAVPRGSGSVPNGGSLSAPVPSGHLSTVGSLTVPDAWEHPLGAADRSYADSRNQGAQQDPAEVQVEGDSGELSTVISPGVPGRCRGSRLSRLPITPTVHCGLFRVVHPLDRQRGVHNPDEPVHNGRGADPIMGH